MISRRTFLNRALCTTAGAFAAPHLVPSRVLGTAAGVPAPSNRITVGMVGVGSHGTAVNLANFLGNDDAQVLAVCDVDQRHLDRACNKVNEHYGNTDCATYKDFREVVSRDDLDVIVVSTPDHWHVPIALAAVKTGKDIFCEKPLTLTISEGRVLSDAVACYGRVFQTGSEFRAQANFLQAAELVRNGRIGKLHTIWSYLPGGPDKNILDPKPMPVPEGFDYDRWLGPAPWVPYTEGRCHYQFRWILDYSGGQLTDWGGHLNDQAQWGNDTEYTGPVEVEGEGVFPEKGLYDVATDFRITYKYANGVTLICTSRPRELGGSIKYEGTEGWVMATYGRGIKAEPASLLDSVIGPGEIRLYTCPSGPERNFLDCVKSRKETYYPAEVGHRSVTISHLGNIAMLLGRKLKWDPDKERFINDPTADRMLARSMRAPWCV